MKTQKKFVTSGMFKRHTILGVCLILVALFAPFAHAETVDVNPGTVGKEAQNFAFSANSALLIDILFNDNKTLEWEAGTHVFVVVGEPGSLAYGGVLLDAAGDMIPGTEFVGETPDSVDPVSFGAIDLDEMTVFSGIRFLSSYDLFVGLSWNWNSADRPIVGQTQSTATVITDGDGNVTRIENLPVLDEDTEEPTIYNVDFLYDSAVNVYATGEFDFPERQDTLLALEAVTDALNFADPTPPAAGPQGTDQFFIGNTEREGLVIALGGQNIEGVWGDCETGEESDCLAGVAVLSPGDSFTYAKFTETQDVPPGPATLISPSGAIIENIPPYTWNAVADSTWYNLIVKDDTEEVIIDHWYTADAAGCGDGTGECSVTPVDVLADGSHQWLIQTWNEFGEGPLSDGMSFTVDTTGATPGPATLISPSGTITVNTPAYTWDAVENSTWYRLFVWDSTETEIIDQWYTADEAGCSDGTVQCSVTPETVLADDSHEWWIRTWNDNGNGPWSDELSFTVDTTGAPPGPATLISPSDTITDNTPTYTWDAVAESTYYRLFVWDSTETTVIDEWYTADEAGCSVSAGGCSVTPETVLADDSHEWYIRTWNPSGNGPWSDELSFTVDSSSAPIVELDGDGNVIRIENLPVFEENTEDPTIYDVDFVYSTAFDIYGEILDFDFTEEDVFPALLAVTTALNENDPVPVGAGPQGSNQFFIGADEENDLVEAVGGENIEGVWDQCETDCSAGVTLLAPIFPYTYAVFTELDLD